MKFEFKLLENLKSFRERVVTERAERIKAGENCMSFGVKFLDESLGGIYNKDLILYGAKTGVGKTALATITAKVNAAAGKRVHFFALEAEDKEIERRIKYEVLAEAYFRTVKTQNQTIRLNYRDWYYGKLDKELGMIEDEIDLMMTDLFPHLKTFYKRGEYTVEHFEKQFLAIQDETDLVIIDHLHYFDSDDDNENRSMKRIVKTIRDLALEVGKPVIVVAHMRKTDRKMKQLCPGPEDFHGSSDIPKIATKAVTLAPCFDEEAFAKNIWPTYMRAAKCRVDNSVTRYVALGAFNSDRNQYQPEYFLGQLNYMEDDQKKITKFTDLPHWAKAGQIYAEKEEEEDKK